MSLSNRQEAFAAIRTADNLGPGPKLLLVLVGDLVADEGTLDVGCDWLAVELAEPRSSVQRWRQALVEGGLLTPVRTVQGGRSANSYRLTLTAHPRAEEPAHNRPPTGGKPITNRPPTAHQPPTHGREQEQEQEPGARSKLKYWTKQDPDYLRWAEKRTARRKGSPALLEKILAEDHDIYLSERSTGTTDPSPPRNDPATCPHKPKARTSDGDCAACGTENVSMPEPALHPYESTV